MDEKQSAGSPTVTVIDVEKDVLSPQFGLTYIGYPAAVLVAVALGVSFVSVPTAMGLLLLAVGYAAVGVGFVITLLYYRRYHRVS